MSSGPTRPSLDPALDSKKANRRTSNFECRTAQSKLLRFVFYSQPDFVAGGICLQ